MAGIIFVDKVKTGMQADLKVRNIVLVGNFNITAFDKYFFIKNQIVSENDIAPNSVFANSQGIAQLFTNKFHFLITINQIVITALNPTISNDIDKIVSTLITAGNMQVITSFGFNFHWFLNDDSKPLEELSKNYFYNDKVELIKNFFNDKTSVFGVYASTVVKDSRLKLDVKPMRADAANALPYNSFFNFAFNYHFEVKNGNDISEVLKCINDYDFYYNESEKMISIYKQ
jgi:hypothetical protein